MANTFRRRRSSTTPLSIAEAASKYKGIVRVGSRFARLLFLLSSKNPTMPQMPRWRNW